MDTIVVAVEMKSPTNEALRAFQHEKESRAKDHDAYDDQVVGLRKKVNESPPPNRLSRGCIVPLIT